MGTKHPVLEKVSNAVMATPFVAYSHQEIKRIRLLLGKSHQEFADLFRLSVDEIKAWQTPPTSKKHREPSPPACLILYWCAVAANEKTSSKNNRLRLAAKHGPNWLQKAI